MPSVSTRPHSLLAVIVSLLLARLRCVHPLSLTAPAGTPSGPGCTSYSPGVLCAIAFCPAPPLLVPAVAAGAAGELDGLRVACAAAVDRLLGTGPDEVVVLGPAARPGRFPGGTAGTLTRYGVPVAAVPAGRGAAGAARVVRGPAAVVADAGGVAAGAGRGRGALPGGRGRAGRRPGRGRRRPVRPAARAAGDGGRVGLPRAVKAPGYDDPRAAAVRRRGRGGAGHGGRRRAARPGPGARGGAAGRRPAAPGRCLGRAAAGPTWRAELLYDDAPYGVAYFVAVWAAPVTAAVVARGRADRHRQVRRSASRWPTRSAARSSTPTRCSSTAAWTSARPS